MKLSIVATLYQSAPYIQEFYERSSAAARKLVEDDYEIVLVNDGSPDNSLELAVALTEADPHVMVVDLSRNFGHHRAMMTGLAHSQGDLVFLIDSDLEEEPEWLLFFAKQREQDGCDVVYGVQQKRKGRLFERWSGEVFYWMFRWATGLVLSANIATARLMSRRYVDALLRHQEREVFLAGLLCATGFVQSPYLIKKSSKPTTTYTLRKKIALFVNAVTSFSSAPLLFIFYLGLSLSVLSFLYIMILFMQWAMSGNMVSGWTSTIVSIWLLGGLIILSIGVVGVYLSKIFCEVKKRPYAIVRDIYRKQ